MGRLWLCVWAGLALLAFCACEGDSAASADSGGNATDTVASDSGASDAGGADTAAPDGVELPPPGLVRFIHISDMHVQGSPDDPRTGHLEDAAARLAQLDFDADFVAATGDWTEWIPEGLDPAEPGALSAGLDIFRALPWRLEPAIGNHEYYRDGLLQPVFDKAARESYVSEVFGKPLDYSFIEEGVRFVVLNSMAGDRWETNAGLVGSFTDEQLGFLRAELLDGRPTILFFHHPPAPGIETPTGDSMCAVFEEYPDSVVAVFAGHLHGFLKGDLCGVPYYLVANVAPPHQFYFLVEYDGAEDSLTIVNDDEIPWGEVPDVTCDPEGIAPAGEGAVGTRQVLRFGGMTSNLPGLETFDGDGLDEVPFVVHFDGWDADESRWDARWTMGIGEDGFVRYLDGAVCQDFAVEVDGSCAVSDTISFALDAMPLLESLLEVSAQPDWKMRIDIQSLWLEGTVVEEDGVPVIADGLAHIQGSGARAITDLESVLVTEYCAGRIEGCEPGGEGGQPACAGEPATLPFDDVPASCDVTMGEFSLRFLLMFVSTYPLDNINIVGSFTTERRPMADVPTEGAVAVELFSEEPGRNCARQ